VVVVPPWGVGLRVFSHHALSGWPERKPPASRE